MATIVDREALEKSLTKEGEFNQRLRSDGTMLGVQARFWPVKAEFLRRLFDERDSKTTDDVIAEGLGPVLAFMILNASLVRRDRCNCTECRVQRANEILEHLGTALAASFGGESPLVQVGEMVPIGEVEGGRG